MDGGGIKEEWRRVRGWVAKCWRWRDGGGMEEECRRGGGGLMEG